MFFNSSLTKLLMHIGSAFSVGLKLVHEEVGKMVHYNF
jgi:hypothetical protein